MSQSRYNGITGVKPAAPVGAVLRIGIKGPKGAPTDRDRFYICQPKADASKSRPLDPRFSAFNTSNALDWRRDIFGELVHAAESDIWSRQLICYRPKGQPSPPTSRPYCVGDGVKATRWDPKAGERGEFVEIPCPNGACQFRQKSRSRDGCKPHLSFLFRPTWPEGSTLPTPLMRLDSRSWNSVANFEGFFEHIREQVDGLKARGIITEDPSLFGLKFRLSLREQTNASERARFPVLTLSATESVKDWLIRTASDLDTIRETYGGLTSTSTDEDMSHLEEVDPFATRKIVSPAMDGSK